MLKIHKKIKEVLSTRKYYNDYYNQSITRYKDVNCYLSVYGKLSKNNCFIHTKHSINHSSTITFGNSLSSVKKKIDVPYSLVKVQDFCRILFYKIRIGRYKMIVELHFYKKKLVFFKYTFPALNNKREVESYVMKKYLLKNQLIDFSQQAIVDNNHNYLKVDHEIAFSIYYLSKKYGFYDYLKKKKKSIDSMNLNKENYFLDELIDKL